MRKKVIITDYSRFCWSVGAVLVAVERRRWKRRSRRKDTVFTLHFS